MSILTKEERENWRSIDALGVAMMPEEVVGFILRALDTIDALEATASHDTRTVGSAHAALREILAVIEGMDDAEEGEQ